MRVPDGWRKQALEQVAEIQTGLSKSAARVGKFVMLPYLRVANVQAGYFDLSEIKQIEVPVQAIERYRVRSGDLLLTEGGDFDKLGRGALWDGRIQECVHQNHVFVVRARKSILDPRFLAYQTQGPFGRAYFLSCAKQSTNLASINSTQLKQFPTLIAPLPEQDKIARILETWDSGLSQLEALIKAKERRKIGLMQLLLTARLRFDKFGEEPWKKVQLSKLLERTFRAIEWSAENPLFLVSLRRRFGGLFRRPTVTGADYKTQDLHELKSGDFLISKRQVVHGAWALVTPGFEGSHVSKEYAILVNIAPGQLDMSFFAWLAKMPAMTRLARVSSTGVHIEKLIFDPQVFLNNYIRIPPTLAEQNWIASTLDACEAEIGLLKHQRSRLVLQKRGLVQRLLTGRIRVKVP
jgi:type I restriction enzyme, S subunit